MAYLYINIDDNFRRLNEFQFGTSFNTFEVFRAGFDDEIWCAYESMTHKDDRNTQTQTMLTCDVYEGKELISWLSILWHAKN